MPSDRRMFNRKIFQSSVCVTLAEKNQGKELHAQRIWEVLILNADDYGRGKLIPLVFKMEAFASCPTAYNEVSLDEIEKWISEIEETGAIVTYKNDVGERFYAMTGWFLYQTGFDRQESILPPPPEETLYKFKIHPKTTDEKLNMLRRCSAQSLRNLQLSSDDAPIISTDTSADDSSKLNKN